MKNIFTKTVLDENSIFGRFTENEDLLPATPTPITPNIIVTIPEADEMTTVKIFHKT